MNKRNSAYPHIITSPRIAVRAIAGYYQLGMSVDEILQSLPHLTQSKVHAALTFYFDHQGKIDRDLRRNSDVNYWRKQVKQSPTAAARAANGVSNHEMHKIHEN